MSPGRLSAGRRRIVLFAWSLASIGAIYPQDQRNGAVGARAAAANLNPWTEAHVEIDNPKRGPLLIVSGEKDHTVPHAIAYASFEREKRNEGVTEFVEIPGRGHALTIDRGWREVAQTALAFVRRFV
jgi:non-heme chloroperoxidase